MEKNDVIQELNYIQSLLKDANEWGLQAEVVTFALKYMKENPKLDICDAITFGYEDWIK